MKYAKELIVFLTYWAKEMAPERKDTQSVTFTVAELNAVLWNALEETEAYKAYLAALSPDSIPPDTDTSAAELVNYAAFNEELLRIGEVFDPPSVISFTLEQLETLRQEILSGAETYRGFQSENGTDQGGFYEPS